MRFRSVVTAVVCTASATLVCATDSHADNSQMTTILQGLVKKYENCIVDKYETPKTANLTPRDKDTCLNGQQCTLTQRLTTLNQLRAQANAGDPTNFQTKLESAILRDCMECSKHREFHTKHAHCTMECDGNNGIFQGPCFESCKAGVDIDKFVKGIVNDIRGVLQSLGAVKQNDPPPETGGASIAKNHTTVIPPLDEDTSCDPSGRGYFLAPKELLDWSATDAQPFKHLLTNYSPGQPHKQGEYRGQNEFPGQPQNWTAIGASEGRLRPDLRQAAQRANPNDDLCKSAVAFAANKNEDGNAFADLAVTGKRAFAEFKAHPPTDASVLSCLQANPNTRALSTAQQQAAAQKALDRAYRVLHLIRAGGWGAPDANNCRERGQLSPVYIAVSGEDDQPHRPVNAPSGEFAQHDLEVSVPRPSGPPWTDKNGPPLNVHTRYSIMHTFAPHGSESASCADASHTVPQDRAPMLANDAEVILYIHGMDSRLEEAMDLTHSLHALGRARHKNYTVVSMDLPTSGYADNIDSTKIAPLTADGRAGGGLDGLGFAPNKYVTPELDFIENFVVAFVNRLNQIVPVSSHIKAVVGGSLGGNLTMRLGRPRPDAPWVTNVIPWSPAGIWPSLADSAPSHAGLAVPWYMAGGDPEFQRESDGARRSFFFGGFDWQSKILGLFAPTAGTGQPQSFYWYREGWSCKPSHLKLARIDRYETYDHNFRLWHWRLGMEQVFASHQTNKPGTDQPLYLFNTKRTLLMCGKMDIGNGLCDSTRQVAPKMEYTPGYALFLETTGHSIHNERPNFLARHIADFIEPSASGITMEPDTNRMGNDLREVSLARPDPALCRDACQHEPRCRAYTYVRAIPGRNTQCWLKSSAGTRSENVDCVSGVK
jgi:pimeloyl-ACP methyl ester carboxylesterase